jgi:hypothetical protein
MLTSPFGNLFLALQQRITTVVPDIKWIDQDLGQLEDYKPGFRPAVLWPCVLIDFDEWEWEENNNGVQRGTGFIVLRLGLPPFTASNQATPLPQKESALQYYEIEKKLHAALHGWSDGVFDRMLRRTSLTEKRGEDNLRVRVLKYISSVTDTGAMPAKQRVPRPEPVVGSDMVE